MGDQKVLLINTLTHLENILKKNLKPNVHLVTLTTIEELRSLIRGFPTPVSLLVIIGELLNDNTTLIKSTNFTILDFSILAIHSIKFDFIHIDIPITQTQQRENIINNLTKSASFAKSHFGISINRSSSIDLTNTSYFANDVSRIGQPSKTIVNYARNFLILTSNGSHHNTPISSLSTDEGGIIDQTLFSTLTHRVVITEMSLGLTDDEIASFDSIHLVSDVASIVDLMNLPWETKLTNDQSTILHITVFLPFVNDGYQIYLELPNKARIPMNFFEDLEKKAQQKRVCRFFFSSIRSIAPPKLKNEVVFVLHVKKHLKIVQQIMFSTKWVTWNQAIDKISPKLFSFAKGEKIRAISPLYNKNEHGIVVFENLYSVVSDFKTDSLIPFHSSNNVYCEIYQAIPPIKRKYEKMVFTPKSPIKDNQPLTKLIKIEKKEHPIPTKAVENSFHDSLDSVDSVDSVEDFFKELSKCDTLSISLT